MSAKQSTEEKLAKLIKMGLMPAVANKIESLPTKIKEWNEMLPGSPGGFPKGKVTIVYGPNASHKTSVMVEAIGVEQAAARSTGNVHRCLFIPAERGDDLSYYEDKLGLILEDTFVMPPNEEGIYLMEYVLETALNAMKEGLINSVILDSWDALVAFKEKFTADGADKAITKETVGAKAAVASKLWRELKPIIARENIMFGVICQVRTQGLGGYVTSEGFSGGAALGHNADLVIYQKAMRQLKKKIDGREVVCGHTIKFEQKKIRCGGKTQFLYTSKEIDFDFGDGWDAVSGILEVAIGKGIIIKGGGGWFTYPAFPMNKQNIPKLRGEDAVKGFFADESNFDTLVKVLDAYEVNSVVSSGDDAIMLKISTGLYQEVTEGIDYTEIYVEPEKEED